MGNFEKCHSNHQSPYCVTVSEEVCILTSCFSSSKRTPPWPCRLCRRSCSWRTTWRSLRPSSWALWRYSEDLSRCRWRIRFYAENKIISWLTQTRRDWPNDDELLLLRCCRPSEVICFLSLSLLLSSTSTADSSNQKLLSPIALSRFEELRC